MFDIPRVYYEGNTWIERIRYDPIRSDPLRNR